MNNKELILVDVDETTAESIKDGVYPYVNELYGTNFTYDNTSNYRNVFGDNIKENGEAISLERKIELFYKGLLRDKGFNNIRPIEGSVEKITELYNSGFFDISKLTARNPILEEYTKQWTKVHFKGMIENILFSNCYYGGNITKGKICRDLRVDVMIEDDIDYAIDIAKSGVKKVFLLEKPWNINRKETHKNIVKVLGWHDIRI